MRLKAFFRKMLGLSKTIVEGVSVGETDGRSVGEIHVRSTGRRLLCGHCGRRARRLHGLEGKERRWRDLGIWGGEIWLTSRVHRVLCSRCGVRTMQVPWARCGSIFTRRFEDEVTWFLQNTDQSATAAYFGISWRTVGRIARRVVAEKLDRSLLRNLRFLGIDEISYGRPKKFLTVVVDHERRRVIWAAEGQNAATLGRFFDEIGEEVARGIVAVSIDMDAAFESALRERLPEAQIVYDRFHVIQLLSRAVDEVRRGQVRQADPADKRDIKNTRWALLKNPWNLTPKEHGKLATVQASNQPLYRAYLLKETFQDVYNAPNADEADRRFSDWFSWARRSCLKPFKAVALTLRDHWSGIRRFLQYGISNGPVEGWNSKIRMISHRAFGYHAAAALIAMVFLTCSGVVIQPIGWGKA